MLNHLHLKEYGNALRQAVEKVIADGKVRTRDLGGYASTSEFTYAVIDNFKMWSVNLFRIEQIANW